MDGPATPVVKVDGVSRWTIRLPAVVVALAAMVVGAGLVPGLAEGVVMVAPALLLVVALVSGRYVGEDAIARVRRVRPDRPAGRRPDAAAAAIHRAPARIAPRGGLLLAASLATRPPPLG